ncbi:MAG TPA: FTR1 family protein [Candidatus Sulfotelmatobacter sp.]|jgi:FTR1 family protein|nr:FTR1 family protein [Candidatus Sulfotelmatobacter sp.]
MFTTAIIGFREFLEAFLIVGIFLGVSQKLVLKKEMEIGLAAVVGLVFALCFNIGVFFLGAHTRSLVTQQNIDAIESYLQIFSGLFLVYVIFSLHKRISQNKKEALAKVQQNIKKDMFDASLFFTIIFLIFREGFEIALFSASITLFSIFIQNVIGLLLGFAGAAVIGYLTYFAYTKFSIEKIYKVTEYIVILLGASLFQTGITKFINTYFTFSLSNVGSFHLQFLPGEDSFGGTLLQSFFGVDTGFSVARLLIMLLYIGVVFVIFLQKKNILTGVK